MDILNDDEWLIIFKQFNLNERTHLRLVSKKFKSLLDTIKITKLIIYERWPVVPDQLMHTDEPFSLQDTVEVYNLNKFFNNPIILGQMRSIRQLVVAGFTDAIRVKYLSEIDLNTVFRKLNYLRLRNVMFTNSSLLQSTEIEHLILERSFFKSIEKCASYRNEIEQFGLPANSRSILVFKYQFNDLKSRKIKYLTLNVIDLPFVEYCVEHGLFNSLEQIDATFADLASLLFLNNHCPALKIVQCQVYEDMKASFLQVDKIVDASKQLRDDLSVYLFGTYECQQVLLITVLIRTQQSKLTENRNRFLPSFIGIPFNKASARPIVDFMRQMNKLDNCLENSNLGLAYYPTIETYRLIKRFERDHDLSRFYQMIEVLTIQYLIKDANFINKFNRCEALHFALDESPAFYFKSVDLFARVKDIIFLTPGDDSTYGNEIFDLLPTYCGRLLKLTIQNTNKINFEFVLRFVTLKRLILRLCFPVEQSEFMQMIRTLKHLDIVDIAYVVESANSIRRDELSKFKREVNDCLENELKRPAIVFKIEIHTKKTVGTFIRYVLIKKNTKKSSLMPDVDETKMFQMCQFMSMNDRFTGFGLDR